MKLLITMKLLPTTIINIIREFYINLFLTNRLVNYQDFSQIFHILKNL